MTTDVRQAMRRLVATPLLSGAAVVTLALGIGSAVVMADVLDRLLLRPPAHVVDPDRVARVYIADRSGAAGTRTGYATLEALGTLQDDLEASAASFSETLSLGRGERARRLEVVAHTRAYFTVLGLRPHIGSWSSLSPESAVISYGLWQQTFGGTADIVGKPLQLGVDTYTIGAVMPRGFAGLGIEAADVWLPLERRASLSFGEQWKTQPYFLEVIARLRPVARRERANERATAAYRATHTQPWEKAHTVVFGDLRPARAPGATLGARIDVLVAGVSILVLLVTCGNVANLLLVRGLRRGREFVVKTALGASRARLLREVLLEAALLAAASGIVAYVVVLTAGVLLRRLFLSQVAALVSPLDVRLVLLTVGMSTAAAFVLGLAPALHLTSRRALSPGQSAQTRPSRLLDLFSALQVALSLPMIAAAALFVLSFWNARHQNFGIESDRVAVVTTNLFELGRPMENHAVHRQLEARVARLPQVEATAMVESLPMRGGVFFPIEVPGRVLGPEMFSSDGLLPAANSVDPSFFGLMHMRLVSGRFFGDGENRKGARSVAVITETMAHGFWPGESAVGKCFYMGGQGKDNPCTEVVGIVADARLFPSIRPTKQWASAFYVPIEQGGHSSNRALLVRTSGSPASVVPSLRREAQVARGDLPYVEAYAFDDVFDAMLRPWRLGSTVFLIFGAMSLVVAAVGLMVVGAYGVTRRTREIGIRAALGAEPADLVRLVMRRSLGVVALGLIVGLAIALASRKVLDAQLFDIGAGDPRVLAAATLGLLVVGAVAGWLPARRAARIDPVIALRAE